MTGRTTTRLNRRAAVVATGVALSMASAGCAPKYEDLKVFSQAHRQDVTASQYRLEPPDVIQIESPTAPEIDGEIQRIRSDGKITLRLIGDVQVSGLTPEELSAKLAELLSRYYESPEVTVRLMSYESKSVYVFGQVMGPGPQPFTGRDTLLDVIARAQPNFLAWGAQVKVIRPSAAPEERHELVVDVDKMLETGDMTNNFLLQEGDIVFVPPTPLGYVGLRIQELLFPISPALAAYNAPVQARNTTDSLRYGGYHHRDDYNHRRQLMWPR
ncbi:MAG TPA: polysaccharide biosynthesis/export family protein [Phycisphaerae bacterium]|nr:polysaccharide biosynthesis/export family protein [Phycisphaerae bacterium]HOJ75437.1 polysaccharide biosynthesis/export family protein [Phycisphaerae bacterium]HOM52237.1 polysaccharide biosynthesis/export family protein [Phycisphaerae bacterium]HON65863.1 polysaccharide biosynthesis/export family protein [Phycisphaerae bacterium]HOQ84131.1 polysaccharide biosynthesis/export family protein [Phycisphaerae bacterium]